MTDEQKPKTWEYQGKTFKKCPQCGKGILAEWNSHQCGWGKEEENSTTNEIKAEPPKEDINLVQLRQWCFEQTENLVNSQTLNERIVAAQNIEYYIRSGEAFGNFKEGSK